MTRERPRSRALFERAARVIPGGVNSPVRAFGAVGGTPPFLRRAAGARVYDEDGNEYIDYVGSWGPMLFGHAHPRIVEAVVAAAADGTSFGAPTEREVVFAERIVAMVPGIESVRLVSSGTEATMAAVRVARAATGRPAILKFEGCYHGHADPFLVKAGSGAATFGAPSSPGVPPAVAADTLNAVYNDLESVRAAFAARPGEVACVIVEPVAGNVGLVAPEPGFLSGLSDICRSEGALLVFDEVMTGFRVARGGAQERYGVTPDLTTLGKIVGGGLPLAAYGGRRDLMETVSPAGPVYQAGTLSGNPLAVAAGLAMLDLIDADPGLYGRLESLGARLEAGLRAALADAGVAGTVPRVGSMFAVYFGDRPVRNFADAKAADQERFRRYFHGLLDRGVHVAPSPFEAGFLSAAHTEADVDRTVAAAREALS